MEAPRRPSRIRRTRRAQNRGGDINTLMDPSPDPRNASETYAGAETTNADDMADTTIGSVKRDPVADRAAEERMKAIVALLEDEKAEDIVTIDLRGKASYTDFMVIASGRSSRHVGAICEKLIDALKEQAGARPRAEGVENGDWALIDASDVVVHVFRPEVREFYALEKMWSPSIEASDDDDDAPKSGAAGG